MSEIKMALAVKPAAKPASSRALARGYPRGQEQQYQLCFSFNPSIFSALLPPEILMAPSAAVYSQTILNSPKHYG